MDVVVLAGAAVAVILPFLGQVTGGVAGKLGEKAVETGGQLIAWIRTKASGDTVAALEHLEAAPDDPALRKNLETALTRQLEAAPVDAAELEALLRVYQVTIDNRGAVSNSGTMTGVVTNSSNVSVQIGN